MSSLGRGRAIRQRMFGRQSLYGTPRPSQVASAVATTYFFNSGFVGSQALDLSTNLPGPIQTIPSTETITAAQNAMYFYIPCIPGQQYTTSAYVRQVGGPTALRLSITGGVLNVNPYFTQVQQVTDWAGSNTTVSWVTAPSRGKTGAMAITPAGAVSTVDAHTVALYAAVQSDLYTASAWVYSVNGWSDVRTGINWYDGNGSLVGQSTATSATVVPAATWTQVTAPLLPTRTAAQAQMRIIMNGTPSSTDVLYVSEATLAPTNSYINSSYFDQRYSWQRPAVTFTATAAQHTLTIGTAPFMNANGTFESGIAGWTATASAISASTDFAQTGTGSMLVVPDGSGSGSAVAGELDLIPYGATNMVASAWIYSPKGYSDFRTQVSFYDSTGSLIFTPTNSTATSIPAGVWTNIVFNCAIPQPVRAGGLTTSTWYASLRVQQGATPATTDFYYVDAAYLTYTASNIQSSIFVDALQHELGNATSTWSSTGPAIYGIFGGFVERWPSSWNFQGTYGLAQITGVDAFSIMSNRLLHTEYANAVLATQPTYYWRLNEASTALSFADTSGNQGAPLTFQTSKYGGSTTHAPGTATNIVGDPSGTGIALTGASGSRSNGTAALTVFGTGEAGTPSIAFGNNIGTWGMTMAFWFVSTDTLGGVTVNVRDTQNAVSFSVQGPVGIFVDVSSPLGAGGILYGNGVANYADGKPHLYVARFSIFNNSISSDITVDNTFVAGYTGNVTTQFGSPSPSLLMSQIQVGGQVDPFGNFPGGQGTYAHIALWSRSITDAEVAELNRAGVGYPSELTSTRIARYLGYNFIARSSIETSGGNYTPTVMGTSALAEATALLDAGQGVTLAENGNFFVEPSGGGIIQFQVRNHRYTETSAKWTFGENTSAGEIPYNGDIAFDFDPTQVYNDIQVTRTGGTVAVGGDATSIATSKLRYGQRSYTREINISSDKETQDAANWLFQGHQDPHQRLQSLTINPGANPNIWSAALGIRISDRVTVNRRTSAGFTISADFFVERIEHQRNPGEWLVTYQLSPFAATAQPGFFEDGTYGRLGSTSSMLEGAVTASATSLLVFHNSTDELWTTTGTPLSITVDSETMTATAISTTAFDLFTRTLSNQWGSATSGQAWTTSGGSASDYATTGTAGTQSAGTVGVLRYCMLDTGSVDQDFYADVSLPVASATGGGISQWAAARMTDVNNYYAAQLILQTSNAVTLSLVKRVGGTLTTIVPGVTLATAHLANDVWRIRIRASGTTIQAKAWIPATQSEPSTWSVSTVDPVITTGTLVALVSRLETGNTNTLPVVLTWDNFTVTNPQTFTVTRTNGVLHATGAPVSVTNAFRLAY